MLMLMETNEVLDPKSERDENYNRKNRIVAAKYLVVQNQGSQRYKSNENCIQGGESYMINLPCGRRDLSFNGLCEIIVIAVRNRRLLLGGPR